MCFDRNLRRPAPCWQHPRLVAAVFEPLTATQMDNGRHVLTHDFQHVASIEYHPGLVSRVDEKGQLVVAGECISESCDGDVGSLFTSTEDHPTPYHERAAKSDDCHIQCLKDFSFQRRHHSMPKGAGRVSLNGTPRSRHSPMFLSPLPRAGMALDVHWSQDLKSESKHPLAGQPFESRAPMRRLSHSHSWPPATAVTTMHTAFGVTPPLTPPEDLDDFTWTISSQTSTASRQESLSSDLDNQATVIPARNSSDRSTERPSTITLPAQGIMQSEGGPSTWLGRAVQTIGEYLESSCGCAC